MLLRNKLVLISASSIILVAAALVFSASLIIREAEHRFENATLDAKAQIWRKINDLHLDEMAAASSDLIRDRDLKKSLQNQSYKKLAESTATSFRRLSTSGVISELYILNRSKELAYSSASDAPNLTSHLIQRAIDEGVVLKQITTGLSGHLALQVIFPITIRGQVAGVGVFEKSLLQSLEELKKSDHSSAALYDHNGLAITDDLPEVFRSLPITSMLENNQRFQRVDLGEQSYAVSVLTATGDITGNSEPFFLAIAKDFTSSYQSQSKILVTSAIVACGCVTILLFLMRTFIVSAFKPLNKALASLRKIASGNFAIDIPEQKSNDEVSEILNATKQMLDNLKSIVSQVRHSSDVIELSTRAMENISDTAHQSVKNQLDETHHVISAFHQLDETVRELAHIADNSTTSTTHAKTSIDDTCQLVGSTNSSIRSVAKNISQASKTINELNQSLQKIFSAIMEIRGISEQTNLLALNAAIEAARAGEQGRGFAVVADEVRNLAQRTQQSTEHIELLISNLHTESDNAVKAIEISIHDMTTSVEKSNDVDAAIQNIAAAIQKIEAMNLRVSQSADDQATAFDHIMKKIAHIGEMSEATASGSAHASRFSSDLRGQAKELKRTTDHFKL